MMDWAIIITVVVFSVVAYYFLNSTRRISALSPPPGPSPLALINILLIARQHPINYKALDKISQKYGEIASLNFGPRSNILVSRWQVAKDLISRSDCLNRPINGPLWERILKQNIGIAFSNGVGWSEIRRFTIRALKNYGFGSKNAMETLIKRELTHLITHIKEELSQSTDDVLYFDKYFQVSFLNVMSTWITGYRQPYDNEEFKSLVRASKEWFEVPLISVLTLMTLPWMRFICPKLLGFTRQMEALNTMHTYARKILHQHRRNRDFIGNPQCFTDSFLKMAYEQRSNPNSIYTDDQFVVLCTDLIQGGADTTATWLSFAIFLLMQNPRVQDKVAQEIADTTGSERTPETRDKDSMIYTQAVMYEVHRFARLTVILPPRISTNDFEYKGYLIKKNSTILVNLHSCYMDPTVWESPDVFYPERFLDSAGHLIDSEVEKMSIAFGAGKRICFGETLGKESTFLYLTTLIQKFSFSIPGAYPDPDPEPTPGIILSPKAFYVHIKPR